MTSPLPAIAAQNLKLTLGSGGSAVEILKGIDLTVPQGQALALLGPSGSGKSSLMAVLSGLERASSGSLSVAGEDFSGMDEDALARARRGRMLAPPRKVDGQHGWAEPAEARRHRHLRWMQ